MPEPDDSQMYHEVFYYADFYKFQLASLIFYKKLLESDLLALKSDVNISQILDEEAIKGSAIFKEIKKITRYVEYKENKIKKAGEDACDYEETMSHGSVRLLKSVMLLYLQQIKQQRNALARRPNISRYALEAIDTRISEFEEKTEIGVFAKATPVVLLVNEIPITETKDESRQLEGLASVSRPRPVIIGSIEILDSELRSRCLDLYETFRVDGATDRLDTVISEGTRILENRIRSVAKLPAECIGQDLAREAFGGPSPKLRLSEVTSEQEAGHLLFRGVFGFLRNPVQHKLIGDLRPDRVLQILGMIDYLLHLTEGANRQLKTDEGTA